MFDIIITIFNKEMSDKKKLSYREKSSIKFVEMEDPAFIKQIKAKMGYREPATVSDKFRNEEEGDDEPVVDKDDIRNLNDDERPQIVVINEATDLSKEGLEKEIEKLHELEDKKKIEEGRIEFRKPEKRAHQNDEKSEVAEKKTVNCRNQNSKLLSFNDEEEE